MSAKDDYTLLLNILAKTGIDGDLIGEFSKAKSVVHSFNSFQAIQPPPASIPNNTPTDSLQPSGDPNSPPMGDNTTQQPIGTKYDNI
jgi:hypothetical protein